MNQHHFWDWHRGVQLAQQAGLEMVRTAPNGHLKFAKAVADRTAVRSQHTIRKTLDKKWQYLKQNGSKQPRNICKSSGLPDRNRAARCPETG